VELRETYTDLTTTSEHVLGKQIGLGPEGRQIRARHGERSRALGPAAFPRSLTKEDKEDDSPRRFNRSTSAEILTVAAERVARLARTWREHCGEVSRHYVPGG